MSERTHIMDRIAFAGILVALVTAALLVVQADRGDQRPDCYEDEVIVWEGSTNDHTKCVPVDELF